MEEIKIRNEYPLTYEQFIELAEEHYDEGGDTVAECWDRSQFNGYVDLFGPITETVAMEIFDGYFKAIAERRALCQKAQRKQLKVPEINGGASDRWALCQKARNYKSMLARKEKRRRLIDGAREGIGDTIVTGFLIGFILIALCLGS